MDIWKHIVPVLVGALIGYCTNYIAIKMLFRPRRAVKLGNHTLPFTPGVIPKNQGRIARGVGQAVGNQLFTGNDLKELLLTEEMKDMAADSLMKTLASEEETVEVLLKDKAGEEAYEAGKEKICRTLTEKMCRAAEAIDIGGILQREGGEAIKSKVQGTMLAMFVNDSLIAVLSEEIGRGLQKYIELHGEEMIRPQVNQEIACLEQNSPMELWEKAGVNREALKNVIRSAYERVICERMDDALEHIDIAKVVEEKINAMSVDEVERLVLDVMKQELQAVVNLGALIGALLGLLNLLF